MNPGTAALERGLRTLDALAEHDGSGEGLGVVRLAALVGADKTQASRTLATLEAHGLVERDPGTLAYRLGPRLYALAARVGERRLLTAAPPVLRRLVAELGESAHLSVRQGTQVLTLLSESPAASIHAPGRVGSLVPLATTSAGRVLVADLPDSELDALGLGGARAAIARARADGVAIVREEFEPGVVAALNVSAPAFRFAVRLDEAAVVVVRAAGMLSAALAGGGQPSR